MNRDYESYGDDDAEFEQIAQDIQVGDTTEGAAALKRLVEKSGSRRDIGNEVRGVLARDRVQAEWQKGLERVQKKNPGLAQDELLAEAGMTAVRNEIAKDLKELGVPDEELGKIKGNNQAMVQAHMAVRANGHNVRSADDLFDAAAENLKSRGIRFQTNDDRDRHRRNVVAERRAADLTRRGLSADDEADRMPARPEMSEAEEKQKAKRLAAFNEIRTSRGFKTFDDYGRDGGTVRRHGGAR